MLEKYWRWTMWAFLSRWQPFHILYDDIFCLRRRSKSSQEKDFRFALKPIYTSLWLSSTKTIDSQSELVCLLATSVTWRTGLVERGGAWKASASCFLWQELRLHDFMWCFHYVWGRPRRRNSHSGFITWNLISSHIHGGQVTGVFWFCFLLI